MIFFLGTTWTHKRAQIHQERLLRENAKLRSNISAKSVRDAPMRGLIPELCLLVFALAIDCPCDVAPAHVPDCTPLVLSHVCRRWREIVHTNPRLWVDLHINLSSPKLHLVPFWFRQAGDLPVRVTVHPNTAAPPVLTSTNPFKTINSAAVRDLIPYLFRIQALNLHAHQSALPMLFPRGTITDMPCLERLFIEHHGYRLDEFEIGKVCAPKLHTLRLGDPSPFVNMLSDALPDLKVLQVDKIEFWEYPRRVPILLSSCTSLQELSIVFPRNIYLATPEPVFLPAVSCLSLEWRFPYNPIPIFSAVRAPELRQLSLTHSNSLTAFAQETVMTLQDLIQSAPNLASLTLVNCNLTSLCELSTIFYHAPALEELGLVNCHGIGRLLFDLTPADWEGSSTWLCPKLERIKLAGVRDADVRSLINFVRRRMKPTDSNVDEDGHYLQELELDSRMQDFTVQGRLLILRGLSIITPGVKVVGPLEDVQLSSTPFNSPVPKN